MLKESLIAIRVSDELKEKISIKAEKLGLSASSYIRMLALRDLE